MRRAPNPACDDRTLVANIASMDRLVDELRKEGDAPLQTHPTHSPMQMEQFRAQDLYSSARLAFARIVHAGIRGVLQTILQELELPPKVRAKMEAWSRYFARSKPPSIGKSHPGSYNDAQRAYYAAHVKKYAQLMLDIHEARRVGVPHGVCATVDPARAVMAGPFTLVNTGGFSAEKMADVKAVVERAVKLIEAKGVGVILYGDIYVTNTISRARVAAFYEPDTDELFVRANIKRDADTTRTVIHELGHRLDFMFMRTRSYNVALDKLYGKVRSAHRNQMYERARELSETIHRGDAITIKGTTYRVVLIEPKIVRLKVDGAPPDKVWTHRIPKESFAQIKAGNNTRPQGFGAFVTKYASKNAIENFAEMFSFWAMEKLSPEHTAWLVEAIPPSLFQSNQSALQEAQTLLDALGSQQAAHQHALGEIAAWKKSLLDARRARRSGSGSDEVEFATSTVRFWATVADLLRDRA